jgi:hypothetical protein
MPGLPPPHSNELDELPSYLGQQRYVLRLATYGITDAQAREAPAASALSLGGLRKHAAAVERSWAG